MAPTGLDGDIAEKLEEYRVAARIDRGSAEYRQLLSGYRNSPHFGELLDLELKRLRQNLA